MSIFYNPEDYGLEVVAVLQREPEYDFDMVVVWKQPSTKKFFWFQDSGCSCPSPFENQESVNDLRPMDYDELKNYLDNWPEYRPDSVPGVEKVDFLRKVFNLVNPPTIKEIHSSLDRILGE